MGPIAHLAMFAWIPLVFYLFSRYPAQRAIVISFIIAETFLPNAKYSLPGFPDYSKASAAAYGVLLATICFDPQRFNSFKPSWIDIPPLVFCVISPFVSSITNGLGAYDGLSQTLGTTVLWGGPYFLGRLYLSDLEGLRQLTIGLLMSAVVYAPLCLYETRMAPMLHKNIYGFWAHPSGLRQAIRYGGFRPMVFMNHGLWVGVWMMAGTLAAIWLWRTGVLKKLWNIPMNLLVVGLLVTFVLVKSTGAWVLAAMGIAILFVGNWFRTSLTLLALTFYICFTLYNSAMGTVDIEKTISSMSQFFGPDRLQSLEYRLTMEEHLTEKARQRPVFGWGGFGRNRVYEYNWAGELVDITVTDSWWGIVFGINGSVGLISGVALRLLPVVVFCLRYPAKTWSKAKVAPTAVLAVIITLWMYDSLLNAMRSAVFLLGCGGLAGLVLEPVNLEENSNKLSGAGESKPSMSTIERQRKTYKKWHQLQQTKKRRLLK
ncbi:MAG: O-antigen ligase domain-containing protein [Microcoleaceae cyanobacterium MO_207.B10]|nr:O-antigen ligase domain-containing protein [Microcoleaceae cyanobacterium MO_207.B10]